MALSEMPAFTRVWNLVKGRTEPSRQLSLLWLLATATENELPLEPAIEALAADGSGEWNIKLHDLASLLRRGLPVGEALLSVPDLLPPTTELAVQVGIRHNALAQTLRSEAERLTRRQDEANGPSFSEVIAYVAAIVVLFTLISLFLFVYVVPKFKKLFSDFDTELPWFTRGFIMVSDWGATYWYLALLPLLLGTVTAPVIWWLFSSRWLIRKHGIGTLLPRYHIGPILAQAGVVVQQGKPLVDALHVVSTQHPSPRTWRRLSHVYEAVKSGESAWPTLRKQGLVNRREQALLESAERIGNLGWAMQTLGTEIERRQTNRIRLFVQLLQPIAICIVAAFVGITCVAMYMPLIKLVNDLA